MLHQNVTDNFPTIQAPLKAWPIMSADAYMGLPARSCVQSNHIPNLTLSPSCCNSWPPSAAPSVADLITWSREIDISPSLTRFWSERRPNPARARQPGESARSSRPPMVSGNQLASKPACPRGGADQRSPRPVMNGAKVIDPGVEDKRLLVLEAEFAGALTMMRRPGSVLSRVIRDAWDCRDLAVLTKNNPTRATGPHISIIGHITIDELLARMDRTSMMNGYANRFLFACPSRAAAPSWR